MDKLLPNGGDVDERHRRLAVLQPFIAGSGEHRWQSQSSPHDHSTWTFTQISRFGERNRCVLKDELAVDIPNGEVKRNSRITGPIRMVQPALRAAWGRSLEVDTPISILLTTGVVGAHPHKGNTMHTDRKHSLFVTAEDQFQFGAQMVMTDVPIPPGPTVRTFFSASPGGGMIRSPHKMTEVSFDSDGSEKPVPWPVDPVSQGVVHSMHQVFGLAIAEGSLVSDVVQATREFIHAMISAPSTPPHPVFQPDFAG